MNILIAIGILLLLYWRVKNLYYSRLNQQYKYQYFKLRDKLRMYAIEGKIDKTHWMFSYLDTSISKTVTRLDEINIFSSILLFKKHKRDNIVDLFSKKVEGDIKKNEYLKEIFAEYGVITFNYVLNKHYILRTLLKLSLWSYIGLAALITHIRNYIQYSSQAIRIAPETSSMNSYLSTSNRMVYSQLQFHECVN